MSTDSLKYKDAEVEVEITIISSNSLRGMCRSRLRVQGRESISNRPIDFVPGFLQEDADALLAYTYPDLMASLVEMTIKRVDWEEPKTYNPEHPLSFEAYIMLPEPLALQWEAKVYALNPWWLARTEPQKTEDEKKVETSTAG